MNALKLSIAGKNLIYLMNKHGLNATSLANAAKANQPSLFRIVNGVSQDPREDTLKPYAEYFGIEVADLRTKDLTSAAHSNVEPVINLHGRIPVIEWTSINDWQNMDINIKDIKEWRSTTREHSSKTFALRVKGITMVRYGHKESFEDGDIILVDSEREITNGSLVIAQIGNETELVFRKLYIENGKMFLHALNPNWTEPLIELKDKNMIKGVVFEKQIDF